jgi:hypothetical protein
MKEQATEGGLPVGERGLRSLLRRNGLEFGFARRGRPPSRACFVTARAPLLLANGQGVFE